jgi:hypothetical protein
MAALGKYQVKEIGDRISDEAYKDRVTRINKANKSEVELKEADPNLPKEVCFALARAKKAFDWNYETLMLDVDNHRTYAQFDARKDYSDHVDQVMKLNTTVFVNEPIKLNPIYMEDPYQYLARMSPKPERDRDRVPPCDPYGPKFDFPNQIGHPVANRTSNQIPPCNPLEPRYDFRDSEAFFASVKFSNSLPDFSLVMPNIDHFDTPLFTTLGETSEHPQEPAAIYPRNLVGSLMKDEMLKKYRDGMETLDAHQKAPSWGAFVFDNSSDQAKSIEDYRLVQSVMDGSLKL